MEHSSYELSVQLRDAGFPQPDIGNGQVWWRIRFPGGTLRHPAPFQYIKMVAHPLDGGNFVFQSDSTERQVYAPTPLDILKDLGGQYPPYFYYDKNVDLWSCLDREPLVLSSNKIMLPPIGFSNKLAVVAIGNFWLHKNKKS